MAQKKKRQTRKKAVNCPMCEIHAHNRGRFYDEKPAVGKMRDGVCDLCDYREKKGE